MEKKPNFFLAQAIIAALIFVFFLLRLFISVPSVLNFLPYILILLIITNIVFLFINKTNGFFVNIALLVLALLLFIFLIEYFASIAGMVLSFFHALKIFLKYLKKGNAEKIKEKPNKKS